MAAPQEFLQALLGQLWDDAQDNSITLLDSLKAYRKRALGGGLYGTGGELLGHQQTSASGGGFSSTRLIPSGRSATEAAENAGFLIRLYSEVSDALTSASVALTDARIYTEMDDRLSPCKMATTDFSRIGDGSPVGYPSSQGFAV